MNQLRGLWRDTKYLWLACLLLIGAFCWFGSIFYVALLPGLAVSYVYFAFMRYGADGQERGE